MFTVDVLGRNLLQIGRVYGYVIDFLEVILFFLLRPFFIFALDVSGFNDDLQVTDKSPHVLPTRRRRLGISAL